MREKNSLPKALTHVGSNRGFYLAVLVLTGQTLNMQGGYICSKKRIVCSESVYLIGANDLNRGRCV